MRAIDLCREARRAVEKYEENDMDMELHEKMKWVHRLRKRMLTIRQITENFVCTVQKRENTEERLEWDVDETIIVLKKERKQLRQSITQAPWTTSQTQREIGQEVERLMGQFREEHPPDVSAETMKDFFEWAPRLLLTQTNEPNITKPGEDTLWIRIAGPMRCVQDSIFAEAEKLPPSETGTYVLQASPSRNGLQWVPEETEATSSCAEEKPVYLTEEDTNQLELCTEEEIKQIVQRQSESHARESQKTAEISAEESKLSKEAEQLARVLRHAEILDTPERDHTSEIGEKLPEVPVPPTQEQFIKNLGQKMPTKTAKPKNAMSRPGVHAKPKAPPIEAAASKTSLPETKPAIPSNPSNSQAPSNPPITVMQKQGAGTFQAAGFSAFGQPSHVGAMGVAPQLGSLQQEKTAVSGKGSIGGGFGAFASGGNVFGTFSQTQGGQNQNAFAAMAQKQTSDAFGRTKPGGTFNISTKQENAKLFEMRK